MGSQLHRAVLLTLVLSAAGFSAVINVPGDAPTIQAGINAAVNGDTVKVAPGTYYENINFNGKAITVAGGQTEIGPQNTPTIIDGGYRSSVVTFKSGEGAQSVLTGFTIQNGVAAFGGGGVQISQASPTIAINNIVNNTAGGQGAGIYVYFGSPVIHDNLIANNAQTAGYSGGNGEGIYIGGSSSAQVIHNRIMNNTAAQGSGGGVTLLAAGSALIQGNTIGNNSAYSQGGGIYIINDSSALIVNNVIFGNRAAAGGGIYWSVPSGSRGPYAVNNTIADNTASQGPAVFAAGFQSQAQLVNNILTSPAGSVPLYCDGTYSSTPPIALSNDIYSQGTAAAYGGTCGSLLGASGNISVDPVFSDSLFAYGLAPGSPAIDSGTSSQAPATDLNQRSRPLDGNGDGTAAFDMGAYEMQIESSTVVTSSVNPAAAGQTITLTAAVKPVFATGSMQFYDGAAPLGIAPVVNGAASFNTSLTAGTHYISAVFTSTNPSYTGNSSLSFTETVKPATATALTGSAKQIAPGAAETLTATVSPAGATGSVQFLDGGSVIGTVALTAGTAQMTTSAFAPGTHSLTAYYSGDAGFSPSTSPVFTLLVAKTDVSVSIAASPNPVVFGQTETIRVTLAPTAATGTVQFLDGSAVLGTATLVNGAASFVTTTLPVGTHSIMASYSGDSLYNAANSPVVSLVVNRIVTSSVIASSANPAVRNKAVAFTVTLTPSTAAGNVSFYDGATLLATTTLSAGKASFTTAALDVGTHSITAVYSGSANFAGSTSPVLNQVITKH